MRLPHIRGYLNSVRHASQGHGGFGGSLPGAKRFLRRVRSASHYFDGASAPSAPAAGATAKAIEIVPTPAGVALQLQANIASCGGTPGLWGWRPKWAVRNFSAEIGTAANMQRLHEGLKAGADLLSRMSRLMPGCVPQGPCGLPPVRCTRAR